MLVGHAYAGAVIAATRERQGQGARLYRGSGAGRGRDGRRRVLSCRAASAGAQARARRSWADLSAGDRLCRGFRAECFRGGTGGAGGRSAADLAGLHHRRVARPLWKDRPSWFLVAEQDRMIVQDTQRFMAERMKARVRSHAVDHAPIVTAPGRRRGHAPRGDRSGPRREPHEPRCNYDLSPPLPDSRWVHPIKGEAS